jgi:cytoskeletal protein CcmA (bactofilin family)
MWKRDQTLKPVNGQQAAPAMPAYEPPPPVQPTTPQPESRQIVRDAVNIGKSVVIKGELNASEDLTIEGHVTGMIDLRNSILTIGANGNIKAEVLAKSVIVLGTVTGNITASEKIDIRDGGTVEGDLVSPRVGISEGAHFRGSVDMQNKKLQAVPQKPAPGQHHQAQPSAPANTAAPALAH